MAVSRIQGGVAAGGGASRTTTASAIFQMRASFDPTSATQILLGTVPAGARIVEVVSAGGATGGTNPTVDIGTLATADGFANELRADIKSSALAAATGGTLLNTLLTANTAVYGKVGASAATGGTTVALINYTLEDI
jgi:hypothetical protein